MRRFVTALAVVVGMLFAGVVFQGLDRGGGSMSFQSQPAQKIAFRDAVLDGQSLASRQARIEIVGIYQGLSAELEMIYPPNHSALSFGDDSLRLWTENSPREVREYLYNCRQRSLDVQGCVVRIHGYMTTCYLKINSAAQFPCLAVESIEPATRDQS